MLKYNIDYEIMGMLVTLIIAYNFRMNYVTRTRSDKAFMGIVYWILAAQVLDMTTAFTFSLEMPSLNALNSVLTSGYFLSAFATSVAFERYIVSYITEMGKNSFYEIFRKVLIVLYCVHMVLNPITKLAFYFSPDGEYLHGPLYYCGYLIPAVFAIFSLYFIIQYRKSFAKKQWISSVLFLLIVFGAMVVQAAFVSDIYLTFGLIPLALLMILFSLETPDYRKLMKTMEELEEAKQEAWRANRVKSDFLANMSHEIRTPINAILGFDEMILRECEEQDVLSYATNIKSSGHTLLSLVNDILDLSKIEAGKMEIVQAEYDTVYMFSELLKMISPRAKEKKLALTYEIDEKLPKKLFGDDVRLTQVIMNLLTNAVKYTLKGSVTLRVRVEEIAGDQATLFVAVKDTGIGIKPEDTEKLFSEFGRVEGEKTHKIEGTGLGLPITMKCLMLMDSKLEVESTFGEGSVFYFRLVQKVMDATPIGDFTKAGAAEKAQVEVFREDFIAPKAHILVVDDVEMNLKVFQGLLKKSKMQIDTAQSGAKAIEMIKAGRYDCVFMDHQMPEMDGIETLKRLREDKEISLGEMPFIALTANAIAGAREMYLQNGFSDYLTKPIDGFALSAMIRKWVPQEKIQLISNETAEKRQTSDVGKESGELSSLGVLEFLPDEDGVNFDYGEFNAQESEGEGETLNQEYVEKVFRGLEELEIDAKSGLEFAMNDEEFYLELLQDYVNNLEKMKKDLSTYYGQKDWKNYHVKVHALKGMSRTIGANAFSERAKELEFAAKANDESLILEKHDGFLRDYEELIKKIQIVIGG